jgi:hypothetical protein
MLALVSPTAPQTVTIDLRDAPIADAIKALRELSGVDFTGEMGGNPQTPLITLAFEGAPLKTVVREMCRQAGWHFQRFGRGYSLWSGVQDDTRPDAQVDGLGIFVESLSLENSVYFLTDDPQSHEQNRLHVRLRAEAEDDELLEPVLGFDYAITVTLDTGDVLKGPEHGLHRPPWFRPEIDADIPVPPPPPEARTIASIEGDLVLYADITRLEAEFALDDVGAGKDEGLMSVTFLDYSPQGFRPKLQFVAPENGRPIQPQFDAVLIGENGVEAHSDGVGGSGGLQDGVWTYTQEAGFARVPPGFEPVAIRYAATISRDPSKRVHYKFEDIPLPIPEGYK